MCCKEGIFRCLLFRYNNQNDFSQFIVKVKQRPEDAFLDNCYVLYRWLADKLQQFLMGRHGNAQKPFLGKRKKLFLFCKIYILQKNRNILYLILKRATYRKNCCVYHVLTFCTQWSLNYCK